MVSSKDVNEMFFDYDEVFFKVKNVGTRRFDVDANKSSMFASSNATHQIELSFDLDADIDYVDNVNVNVQCEYCTDTDGMILQFVYKTFPYLHIIWSKTNWFIHFLSFR